MIPFSFVQATRVALAMAHPFPIALLALGNDLGMLPTDIAVERDGGTDAVTLEHLHETKDSDPVAVVARRPGWNIRHGRAGTA